MDHGITVWVRGGGAIQPDQDQPSLRIHVVRHSQLLIIPSRRNRRPVWLGIHQHLHLVYAGGVVRISDRERATVLAGRKEPVQHRLRRPSPVQLHAIALPTVGERIAIAIGRAGAIQGDGSCERER
eukprot:TRINITY_DN11881_c0_g1_i3.p2 TRINITY_DN11881_c0_g1~~TRINITY_DN11881_c0_g1_i3.p2  ORF type:complete len:126 (-),score=11.76 TRINITY_DN11881_c0_g1_i3:452-829(-)